MRISQVCPWVGVINSNERLFSHLWTTILFHRWSLPVSLSVKWTLSSFKKHHFWHKVNSCRDVSQTMRKLMSSAFTWHVAHRRRKTKDIRLHKEKPYQLPPSTSSNAKGLRELLPLAFVHGSLLDVLPGRPLLLVPFEHSANDPVWFSSQDVSKPPPSRAHEHLIKPWDLSYFTDANIVVEKSYKSYLQFN